MIKAKITITDGKHTAHYELMNKDFKSLEFSVQSMINIHAMRQETGILKVEESYPGKRIVRMILGGSKEWQKGCVISEEATEC